MQHQPRKESTAFFKPAVSCLSQKANLAQPSSSRCPRVQTGAPSTMLSSIYARPMRVSWCLQISRPKRTSSEIRMQNPTLRRPLVLGLRQRSTQSSFLTDENASFYCLLRSILPAMIAQDARLAELAKESHPDPDEVLQAWSRED